ncbi:hypothetical protein LI82_05005 [Methanococcoides methylutens]|uniref:Uncharacterized protein n=1 Tax=Methanococcoides methylutens TaxID=2226 RepID=A0A099T2F8_METMT|nr:hypothetical protein [Methanococcoides methylutens]KGK99365.1 hypothetical protein LI82_05005 [Methanococcoides methylutens]
MLQLQEMESPSKFMPSETLLNTGNFLVPGQGNQPDACGDFYWSSIRLDQKGAGVSASHCKEAACPDCSFLWKLQRAFDWTVKCEVMTKITGEHPCRVVASVPRDRRYTLKEVRALRTNANARLSRQGVHSALSIMHPFRLKSDILKFVKLHSGSRSSSSFWNYILSESGMEEISQAFDYVESWRDCVEVSPHYHYLCFPGDAMVTGDAELLIHKQTGGYDQDKVYELKTVEDVFKHIMYLLSHCGILTHAGKSKIKAVSGCGGLSDKAQPLNYVSPEELDAIRQEVLLIINQDRENKLVYDEDGILRFSAPEDDDGVLRVPITEFMTQNHECREIIREWIRNGPNVENRMYVEYLVTKLWQDIDSKGVYACRQNIDDLEAPPSSFVFEGLDGGQEHED